MSDVCPAAPGMRVWVKRVVPDSPADESAIQPGHELRVISPKVGAPKVQVAELMSTSQRLDTICTVLAGPVGSPCTLTLFNHGDGTLYNCTLVRRLCDGGGEKAQHTVGAHRRKLHDIEMAVEGPGSFLEVLCLALGRLVFVVLRGLLAVMAIAAAVLRMPQLMALAPDEMQRKVYLMLQDIEPGVLGGTAVMTALLAMLLRAVSTLMTTRESAASEAREGLGGSSAEQRRDWMLFSVSRKTGVLVSVARLAALASIPVFLSYLLDHALLWKADAAIFKADTTFFSPGGVADFGFSRMETDAGAQGETGDDAAGGRGQILRGKVSVVLSGHAGLGYHVTRALQGLGSSVVLACPDQDSCARSMKSLASGFTPATGAWTVTPMKLDMCSMRSIRAFATAVADMYPQVDFVVLDGGVSCAVSRAPASSPSATESYTLGDSAACPQSFVAHAALLHWLRPLLASPQGSGVGVAAEGGATRDAARVVGITGPLHWLASVRDMEATKGVEREQTWGGAAAGLCQRQIQAWFGRQPYESLGRLLFPFELARQWGHASHAGTVTEDRIVVRSVGVGVVGAWVEMGFPSLEGGLGMTGGGVDGGWGALLGHEWFALAALQQVQQSQMELTELAVWASEVGDLLRWEWGAGWLDWTRWARLFGAIVRLWHVAKGVLVRPDSVAVRPILKALLTPHRARESASATALEEVQGQGLFVDAQAGLVRHHPGQSWRGTNLHDLSAQWWRVALERVEVFESERTN